MAQRKTPAGSTGKMSDAAASKAAKTAGKSSASKPAGRSATATKPGSSKPASAGGSKRPPARKGKPKSIVNQKQRPWGMISAAVLVVVFAAVVVGVVIATHKGKTSSNLYTQPALAAAMAIDGVKHYDEPDHTHVEGTVKYPQSPPVGGNHAPIWAQCTGVVYTTQLANENAVHAMEHGGVWVTYNPTDLTKAQVTALAKDVSGVDRVFMTPYAGLKTPVSLQAWGYQLFVPSSTDARIEKFIDVLSTATANYPERGASCSDPYFMASQSTPGHPQDTE